MQFSAEKSAQLASFFAKKQGGRIYILKLVKLLYLSDRLAMDRHGLPISFDYFVSMDHGPVNSQTLNLMNGSPADSDWDSWLSDRANHKIAVTREFERSDLDRLSDSDISVLDDVWNAYGHMGRYELCRFTHEFCGEWQDPEGSSIPIEYVDVFSALGRNKNESQALADAVQSAIEMGRIFAA